MRIRLRASAGLRRTGIALAALACFSGPVTAGGYGRTFIPELAKFEGDFEVGLSHEAYDNKIKGIGFSTSDTTAIERLRLGALGYIYDPRFITFRLDGAWGLRQEKFENQSSTTRSSGTTGEYSARVYVLPEHPYNLEMYASRTAPLFFGRLAPSAHIVSYQKGAIAKYREKPFSLEAGISDNSVRGSNNGDYSSQTEHVSGTAYLGPATTTLSYFESSTDGASASHSDRVRYSLHNELNLPLFTLNSRLDKQEEYQNAPGTGPINRDRVNWLELLRLPLPGRFLVEASYGIDRDLITDEGEFEPDPNFQTFRWAENRKFTVTHTLYKSLKTNYKRQYLSVDTNTGTSRNKYESINALYNKMIPGGKLVLDGSLARSDQKRNGAPSELREPHDAVAPGSFVLNSTLIDVSTISVWVQDPSGSSVLLDTVYYTVLPLGERTEIFIMNLPPPFVTGAQYHFEVDYRTTATEAELRNRITGYGIRFQLFDSSVNPYYSRLESEQILVSGTLPGGPDFVVSDTLGLNLSNAPFIFLGEYQNYRSRLGPFEAWRMSGDYSRQLTPTAHLNGRMAYSRTVFEPTIFGSPGYSDELTETSLLIRKEIPYKQMHVSVGASFRSRRALANTHSYSENAALGWRIGRLEARASATTIYSATAFSTGKERSSTRYYYLTLTRRFF